MTGIHHMGSMAGIHHLGIYTTYTSWVHHPTDHACPVPGMVHDAAVRDDGALGSVLRLVRR